jgi:hypothetical protein
MKFKAVVESNSGDATMKAKELVMALKGKVQYWYANIPKGHITSRFQLCNKLLSSFKDMQVEELDSNDLIVGDSHKGPLNNHGKPTLFRKRQNTNKPKTHLK